jgi:1-aminocyclopropane-1-carboxylate synthase
LSEFLSPAESGVSLIESEQQLAGKFLKAGVFLASGGEFNSEVPGYFRVVFSHEWEVVHEGLQRYCEPAHTFE